MQSERNDSSLGELFAALTGQITSLVRQEIQLAKAETTTKVVRIGKDIGILVAGAAVLYAGLLAIVAALIILLDHWIPAWISALVVGVIVAAVGGYLVQRGRTNLAHEDLTPHQTVESLKENAQWAKEQTN